MKPPLKAGSDNDFQTPPEALKPLFKYLKKDWVIWECAAGEGNLVREFENKGYQVIGTDIKGGHNFLFWQPEKFDIIITNPPYSIKQQFLERCYSLGKPFALLLPLTTFETTKRQELFKKYGIQVIIFDKRINFSTPDGKEGKESKSWFSTAWFTNGLNLPSDLTFVRYNGDNTTQATLTECGIQEFEDSIYAAGGVT